MGNNEMEIIVSVVLPCLNEEETIGESIRQAQYAIKKMNLSGEIIVVDSDSNDKSREIAEKEGARVINQPVRGYGNAYLLGIKEAKGKYIAMGDPDGTHDFKEIDKFIELLKKGADLVLGSRYKGKMMPGSMPFLHRYFGNPVIYKIMNIFFGTSVSDANCGMRAFSKKAYNRLNLGTGDWEFALEMLVKAGRLNFKIEEVPITYYARGGESKLKSFYAGWRNLRFMLLYAPNYLFLVPGLLMLFSGLMLMLALLKGEIIISGFAVGLHFSVLGSMLSILGYEIIALGLYAKEYSVSEGFGKEDRVTRFLEKYFYLERGIKLGGIIFSIGFVMNLIILFKRIENTASYRTLYIAIFAMSLTILGLGIVFSSFFLSILRIRKKNY